MKLLYYTYRKISLFLFFLMVVWGLLFYFTIINEVTEETDDSLENYKEILIHSALQDPSIIEREGNILPFYRFRSVASGDIRSFEDRFSNTEIYIEAEDDLQPVRVLETQFMMPDGQYYELQVMLSILEREDMNKAILIYLATLFVLFLLSTAIGTRLVLKNAFEPLNRLLKWMSKVQPGEDVPPLNNETKISEFRRLNEETLEMSQRSLKAFREQKQFIENASHELQTPLAIALGKLELLAESESLNEEQISDIDEIYRTLGRTVKLNKSLLLLMRIENGQFIEKTAVIFNKVVKDLLFNMTDVFAYKNLTIHLEEKGEFTLECNESLAQALVSNLLKNAMIHNLEGGEVRILIDHSLLQIKNSGEAPLDGEMIFERFYHKQKGTSDSTGLGLSIARSIALSFNLKISYSWDGMHRFQLKK